MGAISLLPLVNGPICFPTSGSASLRFFSGKSTTFAAHTSYHVTPVLPSSLGEWLNPHPPAQVLCSCPARFSGPSPPCSCCLHPAVITFNSLSILCLSLPLGLSTFHFPPAWVIHGSHFSTLALPVRVSPVLNPQVPQEGLSLVPQQVFLAYMCTRPLSPWGPGLHPP